jgi:hypothetical protein
MSTPSVTHDSFVPSRFLKHQLYVVGAGVVVTVGAFIVWPPLTAWLLTTDFLPHAYCYLGNPRLVWTNVAADSFIGLSYIAISATLGYLGYKGRRDIPFHWMFLAFGLFILGCGDGYDRAGWWPISGQLLHRWRFLSESWPGRLKPTKCVAFSQ